MRMDAPIDTRLLLKNALQLLGVVSRLVWRAAAALKHIRPAAPHAAPHYATPHPTWDTQHWGGCWRPPATAALTRQPLPPPPGHTGTQATHTIRAACPATTR